MALMIVGAADILLQRSLPEPYAASPECGTGTGTWSFVILSS